MQIGTAKATLQAHMGTSYFLWSLRLWVELSRCAMLLFKNKADKTFYLDISNSVTQTHRSFQECKLGKFLRTVPRYTQVACTIGTCRGLCSIENKLQKAPQMSTVYKGTLKITQTGETDLFEPCPKMNTWHNNLGLKQSAVLSVFTFQSLKPHGRLPHCHQPSTSWHHAQPQQTKL